MSINWNNIRPLGNSRNDGFEELIRQLARREDIKNKSKFVPLGKPDGGIECYWILGSGEEWGWQAKFFTTSLTSTQWGEIDDSVKTAIAKRPKLKKYFIALPIDPPDAKLEKQKSLLDKWNERVLKWQKWAKDKGATVDFEPWWSSDIISKLAQPENAGLTYFFFNQDEFTDEWFKDQTDLSIVELGKRYTSELNVKLEISKLFDAVARDEKFEKQIRSIFDDFFIRSRKINIPDKDLKDDVSEFKNKVNELYQIVDGCDFQGVDILPYVEIGQLLDSIDSLIKTLLSHFLELEQRLQATKKEYNYYQKYGSEIHSLRDFSYSLEGVREFIVGVSAKLSNKPILLLDGDAGIGKSHLLADVVKNRSVEEKPSLLFLGQHFVTDEDPWIQINKKIVANCTFDEFLGALNSKAEITGSRLVLFIDAVNEGRGRYFWGSNIKSFIKRLEKYKWLGLVVSVRTSYKELIFPSDKWIDDNIIQYTHYGFRDIEYDAVKIFFDAHNIQLPNVPLLHPEFQNPLFLKLFCEGLQKSGYTKVPDGLQGIASIIDFFVESVNLRLSQPNRLDYPKTINVVKKTINKLLAERIDGKTRYIPYEKAFKLADDVLMGFSAKRGLLEELISEGVLSKNIFWKSDKSYEEGVYLAYERFEDHLIADFLLNKVLNPTSDSQVGLIQRLLYFLKSIILKIQKKTNLHSAFSPRGELFHYVQDERACRLNKGLIEAFSIQLPEKTGMELHEFAPHVEKKYPIVESFVQSLLWRKVDTTSEKMKKYVNSAVLSYRGTYDLFWETIISIAAIPNHYFNAYFLHQHLMSFSLADRDATWTINLANQLSGNLSVLRLIEWAWSENAKDYISDESAKLTAITLAWLHTSTDRELRDSATKALVCLLENRINVLVDVLKKFRDVNDPYVYERLFAVAYGCALRTSKKNDLKYLSQYIYEAIFDTDGEVYPHILLRDYARGTIEYAFLLGVVDNSIDMKKVRPPYNSSFIEEYPDNDEIDSRYEFDYKSKEFKDYYWAQNSILSSMTTEYGRGTGGYGDFGRYVFQSTLEHWDVDANSLSNLAVKWVFEKYGYDVEKHGKFDREIGSGRARDTYPKERIGKKYQWLAFYEILARVSDKFPKYAEWDYKNHSIEQYEGAWDPNVRDIDPTIIIRSTGKYNEEEKPNYWWSQEHYVRWDLSNKDWVKQKNDLPAFRNLTNVTDSSGEEWLVLEGYPEWAEPKILGVDKYDMPHKRLWLQIRSYLIKENDYKKVMDWMKRQDFLGRWMPESHEKQEIFSREYYWSQAYKYFQRDYYGGNQWQELTSRLRDKTIACVMVTSENYFWDKGTDQSKKGTLNFLKPCADIFNKMKMSYSDKEGEFINENGELICFDPSVYNNCKPHLLVRKNDFLKYLNENKLQVIWALLGEKNIVGDWASNRKDYPGMQVINGVYYLKNDMLEGKTRQEIN